MRENKYSSEFTLSPPDNKRLLNLCGRFDEHLRQIEKQLDITIENRGHQFKLYGREEAGVLLASKLLKTLYEDTSLGLDLNPSEIHLSLAQHKRPKAYAQDKQNHPDSETSDSTQDEMGKNKKVFKLKTRYGEFKPRTANQAQYLENIHAHDINFGIGPAGTGKTFLAVACAVEALEQEKIHRILLVRPAVEAGEKLGFLPGDLAQKIDPYLRPLYDALYEMLGFEKVGKLIEKQIIEIAPLAYMRGRTLNDAFIILDESQNTTPEQMKMFLTRLGLNSTAVITGDITQVDLPKGKTSGLKQILKILPNVPGISFTFFDSKDVVRHPVVQRIIDAYDAFDAFDKPLPRFSHPNHSASPPP
ncbi:MAG: PhoH family protein [Gammaproteobacteria bacterium]